MQTSIFFFYGVIMIVTAETEPEFPLGIVIGISVGGFSVLLATVTTVYLVRRHKKRKQSSVWDEMPRDVSCPGDEKYELDDKKEGVGRYGEGTICSIETRFEGLGVSNDAGQFEETGISDDAVYYDEMGILNKAMQ